MRLLIIIFGLFVYVAADLTVNNGASFRGWGYYIATLMRTTGII